LGDYADRAMNPAPMRRRALTMPPRTRLRRSDAPDDESRSTRTTQVLIESTNLLWGDEWLLALVEGNNEVSRGTQTGFFVIFFSILSSEISKVNG
jgi:hypothetical protein